MMTTVLSSLQLFDYLLNPSTVVTHLVGAGLLCALRLQGIGRGVVLVVSVAEELFAYLLWIVCPSGLVTVFVIWVFLKLYEYILGPRLSLKNNAVLVSDDSFFEVILRQSNGIEFELRKDSLGQFLIQSTLSYATFCGQPWFKQKDLGDNVFIDNVISLNEGCDFEIFKKFRSFGIKRDQLISLSLDSKDDQTVVLVARTKLERDKWMVVLHQVLGTHIIDIRSAWFNKVLSIHCPDKVESDKKTNFEDALNILSKAGRPYDRGYAHEIFKKMDRSNGIKWKLAGSSSSLTRDQLFSFFSYAAYRPEISEIYNKLIDQNQGKATLHQTQFRNFIREKQKQDESRDTINQWIHKNEPISRCRGISSVGFSNYLLSDEHSIFRNDCKIIYQDMNQPLSHYFISTSHNTYLTKDQLTSRSSVEAYITALKRGCKCVELDIWDGANNEPIVYHGYTLTSKILVKDVLHAIKEHAFCVSLFPVILSFENHCSTEQQKVVARYVRDVFGAMLYAKAILDDETELPSPASLQGYIIVKGKKLMPGLEEPEEDLFDEIFSDEDPPDDLSFMTIEESHRPGSAGDCLDVVGKDFDVLSLRSENDEDEFTSSELIRQRRLSAQSSLNEIKENLAKMKKNAAKMKEAEKKLSKEFSDLVVCCQATDFRGFDFARENNRHYHIVSLAEKRAFKMAKDEAVAMMKFSQRQLCRVYPSGARIDSSNYDPVPMWNAGCQLVALNFQTPSLGMQLNQALFQDNGGCGYVLKPKLLVEELNSFDQRKLTDNFQNLQIRVISGFQIPYKNKKILKSERSLSVQVRIWGFEPDTQCLRTKIVKNNGLNPIWNEKLAFRIHAPDMTFVMFTVLTKDAYSGHYALPLRCIRQGYRRVPLLNKFSEFEPFAHLFVHINFD